MLLRRDAEEGLLKRTKVIVIHGLGNLNSTIWNLKEKQTPSTLLLIIYANSTEEEGCHIQSD